MSAAYSDEQTAYVVAEYEKDPSRETVSRLAKELGKSERSVTSKLSKEGVYQKKEYRSKTGGKPITKEQIVEQIIAQKDLNEFKLLGLDKAPKLALTTIAELLEVDLGNDD